jgi:pimeloyl-ACP methyl ester carboxylesterase
MATITNALNTPSRAWRVGRRIVRGIGRPLAAVAGLIAVLALVGASYEAIAAAGDARRYPPPGQLIDVGGERLHIQCVGTGTPTVVLDAGLGGSSLDWNLVQPSLGRTTRVCAYDRAGMGWSERSPHPRSPHQIADELHTLLTNAGIAGPYVLVGHSLAGKNVRLFALRYPNQVAGMVLVDARSEYVDANISPAEIQTFQRANAALAFLYRVTRSVGLIRLFGASLWGGPAMPRETRTEGMLLQTSQQGIDAQTAEGLERATDDAQLQAGPSLGDRPLIVLAAGQKVAHDPIWAEAQRRQAALSTNGRLIVAEGSGHTIHWEQPALVIDAVRQVIEQARSRSPER